MHGSTQRQQDAARNRSQAYRFRRRTVARGFAQALRFEGRTRGETEPRSFTVPWFDSFLRFCDPHPKASTPMLMEKFQSVMHQKNKRSKHQSCRAEDQFNSMPLTIQRAQIHTRAPSTSAARQTSRHGAKVHARAPVSSPKRQTARQNARMTIQLFTAAQAYE